MLGTAYLVKYNNKIFVLKTQKILKSQIKKNFTKKSYSIYLAIVQ
jgi:hypothetical protein